MFFTHPRRMQKDTVNSRVASTIRNAAELESFLMKMPPAMRDTALELITPHLSFKLPQWRNLVKVEEVV